MILRLLSLGLFIFTLGCGAPPPTQLRPTAVATLVEAGVDPAALRCNSRVRYGTDLYGDAQKAAAQVAGAWGLALTADQRKAATRVLLGWMVRTQLDAFGGDNLGVSRLDRVRRRDGRPVLLFRSGTLPDASADDGCLASLLAKGDVRHVVNLYAGAFPLHDWIDAEVTRTRASGATHYDGRQAKGDGEEWRDLIKDEAHYEAHRAEASRQVAALIKAAILRPGGQAPQGNILVHCGGGMHRTGMVVGVVQRCLAGASPEAIEAEYKYHVDYQSDATPNGYEAQNLRFVQDFDCGLLAE